MDEAWGEFRQHARDWGIALSERQMDLFRTYEIELSHWNRHFNLTRIRRPEEVVARHFLDSLSCAIAGDFRPGCRVLDVGSGAGFPGVPLKIAFPGIGLTLVESVGKRAAFLDRLVSALEMEGVAVVHARAEEAAQRVDLRGQFDIVVARAVARLRRLVPWMLAFARSGAVSIAMKGPEVEEEVEEAMAEIKTLGGAPPVIHPFTLPMAEVGRSLVAIRQRTLAPTGLPRWKGAARGRPH